MKFRCLLRSTVPVSFGFLLFSCGHLSQTNTNSQILTEVGPDGGTVQVAKDSRPALLSFKELKSLVDNPEPQGELGAKLDKLLRTPYIDNSVYRKSGVPKPRVYDKLGPSLRLSTWNIEKSVRVPEVGQALTSVSAFNQLLLPEYLGETVAHDEALKQRAELAASDVLLVQEMDIGHSRSGYLFAAQHLARKLNMNFMYAPQQLEIDPVYLGLDTVKFANGEVDAEATRALRGDPSRYRGVFGVAVLSRYPIKNVQLFQLKEQGYSWYYGELKKRDFLERGRRKGSEALFHFQPTRELKVGGRSFTRVDLFVPGLPLNTLSVLNVHLEIKTSPKNRERQIKEILSYIKGIKNPVVMAGDYNSSATDVSATSLKKLTKNTASDPKNLLTAGLLAADATGVGPVKSVSQ